MTAPTKSVEADAGDAAAVAAVIARPAAVAAGTFHVWTQELHQGTPVPVVTASPTPSSPACTVLGVQWSSQGGLDRKFNVCSNVGRGGYGACVVVKNEVTAETLVRA